MARPGQRRLSSRVGVLITLLAGLFAVLAGLGWWRHRTHIAAPATSAVAASQPPAPRRAASDRSAPVAPARLTVEVRDATGPLPGATVRFAPDRGDTGDAVALTADRDGVARAEDLAPGTWIVSASAADHVPRALPPHPLTAGADEKLVIQLAAGGRSLRGTVSDATGGPVAGARVDAALLTARAEPSDAVATAVTGADGTYHMTVAQGAVLVAASSPDYAPQARRAEVGPAGAVVDFALVPGGVIEGIVRDARSHEPVAGARVLAQRDSPAISLAEAAARHATTGSDGRYRLGGLRPGAWRLSASDPGRASAHPTVVGLGVAEQVADIELILGASPAIRGRVVDEAGAPAPGAEVTAHASGRGMGPVASVRSGSDGAFTLEGLGAGDYFLTARGEQYLPVRPAHAAIADRDVDGVVLTVRRGAVIAGHVEPRQPCEVQQAFEPRLGFLQLPPAATTGDNGEFKLGPMADGPARLTARCSSGDQGTAAVHVAPGMSDVVLHVSPGASIAGRVLDGAGKPVAGIAVSASDVSHGEHITVRNGAVTSGAQSLTDAAGAYQIGGLAGGSYKMSALDRGRPLRGLGKPPTVELAANEQRTGVDFAIDRRDGVISGTVTGSDGKPLADAWVSVHQDVFDSFSEPGDTQHGSRTMSIQAEGGATDSSFAPALTDAQGHYAVRNLPPGSYTVVAESLRGQLRARASRIRPDATVDLRAVAITSLSGTVTGPAGPPALFSVELDGPTRGQRSFTDGSFSFERVDPGSYTVRVASSDGNGEARVDVTSDGPATVAVTLTANATVIGRLVDASGQPLANIPLALGPQLDGRIQIMLDSPPPTTGADGSFRLEHAAGNFGLVVLDPAHAFSRRDLVLTAGKTLDLGVITVPTVPADGSDAPPSAGSDAAPPRPPATPHARAASAAPIEAGPRTSRYVPRP